MVGWFVWDLPVLLGIPGPRDQFFKVLLPIII